MKHILGLLVLVVGFSAHAKSWNYLFSEDGKWIQQSGYIGKDGWPVIRSTRILKQKPKSGKTPTKLFSLQSKELKNQNGVKLWEVTNPWDWSWELKYSEWVKSEIDATWWKRHGIATDCADALISARWVFARINGLPMANHLSSGAWFTQRSVKAEWEALPTAPEWFNDRRFMAALDYLLAHTFTHSLWIDSYPVSINTKAILPGGYHVSIHGSSGHTMFISKIGGNADDMPLLTLNSTVPRELRELSEWLFMSEKSEESERAFLRMRWPVWTGEQVDLIAANQMPFYSREQFDPNFIQPPSNTMWEEVYKRLDPAANYDLIAIRVARQIKEMLMARVTVVENGYRICQPKGCIPGSAEYEAWSTPSRDERIGDMKANFDSIMTLANSSSELRAELHAVVLRMNGVDYTSIDLLSAWPNKTYSSDPNDPPARRWGL